MRQSALLERRVRPTRHLVLRPARSAERHPKPVVGQHLARLARPPIERPFIAASARPAMCVSYRLPSVVNRFGVALPAGPGSG